MNKEKVLSSHKFSLGSLQIITNFIDNGDYAAGASKELCFFINQEIRLWTGGGDDAIFSLYASILTPDKLRKLANELESIENTLKNGTYKITTENKTLTQFNKTFTIIAKDKPLNVLIEPWGDEINLQPNHKLHLEFNGPTEPAIESQVIKDEKLILYMNGELIWNSATIESDNKTHVILDKIRN